MKLDPVSLRLFVAVMEENAIARAAAREHDLNLPSLKA